MSYSSESCTSVSTTRMPGTAGDCDRALEGAPLSLVLVVRDMNCHEQAGRDEVARELVRNFDG